MHRLYFIALLLLAFPAQAETTYDRVLKTGELRCSYGTWEPAIMRDPNTGEVSGLFFDLMQEIGNALNLKVTFTHESEWSQIAADLQAGKADAHCAGVWATPARGRRLAFSDPITFLPAVAFVREGDARFDNNLDAINNSAVTIAILDDDVSEEIATRDFPLAKRLSLPQLSGPEGLLNAVMAGKADITFDGPNRYNTFTRNHPDKIRMVSTERPIRIFPNTLAVDIHEHELLHMLNTALAQMQDNGTIERLRKKYAEAGFAVDFLLPVVRPYDWKAWDSQMNKASHEVRP
jgi:ABC-type amino acid transport substrate-binding protein